MEKIKEEVMELYTSFGERFSAEARIALVEACASLRLAQANERLAGALVTVFSRPIALETVAKITGELSHKDVRVKVENEGKIPGDSI